MSQNIDQIFTNNPASSMVSTDLIYLGRSPYGATDDFAITFANFVASIGTATVTASTIPRWDANSNFSANNFISGQQSIATAAALTTLTVASPYMTIFTGTTTQTNKMPVVSALGVVGVPYLIVNSSTGAVTVESSGANSIQVMAAGTSLLLVNNAISGTTASVWTVVYYGPSSGFLTGAVLLAPSGDQTISAHNLFLTNGGFISGSATGPQTSAAAIFQAVGLSGEAGYFIAASYINSANGAPTYWTYKSRSTSVGSFTAVQNADVLGRYLAFADDGTSFVECGSLLWTTVGAVSTGIVPTSFTLSTMNAAGVLLPAFTASSSQIVNFPSGITLNGGSTLLNYLTAGSWTPVLTFSTPGDLSVSYATQLGTYTRVGNVVTLTINLVCTPTFTTASGTLIINGLPIISNASAGNASTAVLIMGAIAYPATATLNLCYIGASYTSLSFYGQTPTGTFPQVGTTEFTSGVQVTITGNITYLV